MTRWNHPSNYQPNQVYERDRDIPHCYNDYKKMTLVASITTMAFSVLCIGFLVNELMVITEYIDSYGTNPNPLRNRWRRHSDNAINMSHAHGNGTASQSDEAMPGGAVLTVNQSDIPQIPAANDQIPPNPNNNTGQHDTSLYQATITKVMYTAFICELVLLMISSVALLKGVHQKKQSLIMTWILIVIATILYAGIVVARDLILLGSSARMHAKLGIYLFFIVLESNFIKPAVEAFRDVRRLTHLRHQGTVAVFDPRNPDSTIFSIADTMQPQSPDNLFKLPTYDEVLTEEGQVPPYEESPQVQVDAQEGTSSYTAFKDPRGKPPPYEPPEYTP